MKSGYLSLKAFKNILCVLTVFVIITFFWTHKPSSQYFQPRRPQKLNLSIRSGGRLGNQMFKFASLLGIGLSNDISVVVPNDFRRLLDIFEMKTCRLPMISQEEEVEYHELQTSVNLGYDVRFKDIKRHIFHSKTVITGFLQSFRYFEEHNDLIKSCFQFRSIFKYRIRNFFIKQAIQDRVLVGIHVRRSDFRKAMHKERGMSVPKASYFHKAMDMMDNLYLNVSFIAASDDKTWVKKKLGGRVVLSPFANPYDDFALLASCQHGIISAGTFSWWAGWLANGTTIYYKDYPRNGSSLDKGLNRNDYYYKHWIALGD